MNERGGFPAAALLALGAFAFLLVLVPGALSPYRDSGDLVAAAGSLGIAHPPGYALNTLLTRAGMILFPFGNAAYRSNFLSAFWTALTVSLLFLTLRRRWGAPASLLASALWLLSPAVLRLSQVSEMYTMNAFFCALVLFCLFARDAAALPVLPARPAGSFGRAAEPEAARSRRFLLAFFLLGLGAVNHPTIVFLLPGLLFLQMGPRPRRLGREMMAGIWGALFLAAGFSLVLFYPVRSLREPWLNWGNAENLRGFWRLITRADYGGLKLHPEESRFVWSAPGVWGQIVLFARAELTEVRWPGVLLAAAAFFIPRRRKVEGQGRMGLFFASAFLLSGPLFFLLSNLPVKEETTLPILEPYLLMCNLFLAFWIAGGAARFFEFFSASRRLAWLLFVALFTLVVLFARAPSSRGQFLAYDYGKNLLKTMPPGSSLYDPDDVTAFSISYLQTVERYRRDAVMLMTLRTFWGYQQLKSRHPELMPPGEFKSAQEFIPALLQYQERIGRPLFADQGGKFPAGWKSQPLGLLNRAGEAASLSEFEERQKILSLYVERPGARGFATEAHDDFFTRHLLSRMSAALNNIGLVEQDGKRFAAAEDYFRRALAREPDLSPAWNNLGLNFYFQNDFRSAEAVFLKGIGRAREKGSLYYNLALARRKQGRDEAAAEALRKAIEINPSHVEALNELGLLCLEGKRPAEAREYFERCLRQDRGYLLGYYNLGLACRALGDAAGAAAAFEGYLRLAPDAQDAPLVRRWRTELSGGK